MRKIGQRTFTGIIRCVSGLRIGGSDESLQIGAADLTCIKDPQTGDPYLPGTSIKGKLRSELEKRTGKFGGNGSEPCGCGQNDCLVCRIFGPHKNTRHNLGPTRILCRDARLRNKEILLSGGGKFLIEVKTENVINRMTGTADHPRKVERVVAGAEFDLKIGLQIWDMDDEKKMIEFVKDGLRELTQTGLGAGVSKGYGEIELNELKLDGQPIILARIPG